MLSAGFKFICCSPEDEEADPEVEWTENILSLELLQYRERRIRQKVSTTFSALNSEPRQPKTQDAEESRSLVHSLLVLSRGLGEPIQKYL